MPSLQPSERAKLKDYLTAHFNLDELEDLVFDLSVSYESFPRQTRDQFVRELILYCERRSILSCLLIEVLRRRDSAHKEFGHLLQNLGPCSPRKKIQIILPTEVLSGSEEHLAKIVAQACNGVAPEDVEIIAILPSNGEALLGLPTRAANILVESSAASEALPTLPYQAIDYELLGSEIKQNWRLEARTAARRKSAMNAEKSLGSKLLTLMQTLLGLGILLGSVGYFFYALYMEWAKSIGAPDALCATMFIFVSLLVLLLALRDTEKKTGPD